MLLRTASELRRIGAASPYAKAEADPARHHVTFLATAPPKDVLKGLQLPPSGKDELVVDGKRGVRAHAERLRRDQIHRHIFGARLGVVSTTRNWNTVTKLCELAAR